MENGNCRWLNNCDRRLGAKLTVRSNLHSKLCDICTTLAAAIDGDVSEPRISPSDRYFWLDIEDFDLMPRSQAVTFAICYQVMVLALPRCGHSRPLTYHFHVGLALLPVRYFESNRLKPKGLRWQHPAG